MQAHLDRLLTQVTSRGMAASVATATLQSNDIGIMGREHEYEGGFVILTINHSPSGNDFETAKMEHLKI